MSFMFCFSGYIFKRRALWKIQVFDIFFFGPACYCHLIAEDEYCVSLNQKEDHKQISSCMTSRFTVLLTAVLILTEMCEARCCEESWLVGQGGVRIRLMVLVWKVCCSTHLFLYPLHRTDYAPQPYLHTYLLGTCDLPPLFICSLLHDPIMLSSAKAAPFG